jgi:hypothetical protein
MNNISKSLMILFFILTGCDVHAIQFSTDSDFEVIYEQKFDKKIDEVAFDSYEKDGSIMYYPKIVVFKERDDFTVQREYKHERFDDKKVFNRDKLGISILSPQGSEIASTEGPEITSFSGGKIRTSENGHYFAISQNTNLNYFYSEMVNLYFPQDKITSMLKDKERSQNEIEKMVHNKYEAKYGKLQDRSFRLYNDNGKLLWEREKLWESDYVPEDFWIKITPDGNVLGTWSGKWWIIDPSGNKSKAFPPEFDDFSIDGLRVRSSIGQKYTAIGFMKHPVDFYKELPGKSSEPGIALLDSNRNLLWEKSLDNYLLNWVIISPHGSYIGVETYTRAGVLYDKESGTKLREPGKGIAAKTGCLFNKEGNFLMSLPPSGVLLWETSSPFSENEKYLAIPDKEKLTLYDLSQKKIVYERTFPFRISCVSVSNDGKCALVSSGYKPLESRPTGRPKSMRPDAEAYVVDAKGEIAWNSGEIQGVSIQLLGWDNDGPTLIIMDKRTGYIKIGKVLIGQEER